MWKKEILIVLKMLHINALFDDDEDNNDFNSDEKIDEETHTFRYNDILIINRNAIIKNRLCKLYVKNK